VQTAVLLFMLTLPALFLLLCICSLSPVAYAGWTQDSAELIKLAAGGPAAWLALLSALHNDGLSRLQIVAQALV
jgi:hypothetical protein